jgi:transposase
MAKTLSADLRGRVIAAVEAGASRRAAAERFGVGVATAIRWVRVFQATGMVSALPKGGDLRSQRIEAFEAVILGAIEAQKDVTLVELTTLLGRDHGASFAPSTVHRFLVRHRITLKKSRARRRAGPAGRGPQAAGLVRCAA